MSTFSSSPIFVISLFYYGDNETKKSKSSDDQSFLSSISAQKLAWLLHSLADTAEQYEM